jgi:hypothetical protein
MITISNIYYFDLNSAYIADNSSSDLAPNANKKSVAEASQCSLIMNSSLYARWVLGLNGWDVNLAHFESLAYFSPALRSALRNRTLSSLLLYVSFFSNFSRENFGCTLSTSAASARAPSSRPDKL